MRRPFLAALIVALLVNALVASALRAAEPAATPLSDRVPDDAIMYLGWSGSQSVAAMPGYDQSRLKALLDATNMREVVNQVIPRLLAKGAKKGGADAAQAIDAIKAIGGTLWQFPTAIYFTIDLNGPMPMPHAAVFSRAGKDVLAMQKRLDDLLAHANTPPEVPIRTFVVDDIVGVSVGYDDGAMALVGGDAGAGAAKPLTSSAGFKQALTQIGSITPGGENAFLFYFDNDAMINLADKATMMSRDPNAMERWPRIKEALGLTGMHRVIVASGFDGQDWSDRVFVDAPAPRKGIFAIIEQSPLPDEALQMVPVTATSVAAGGFNATRTIEEIRNMLGEIDPNVQTQFNQLFGLVQMYTSVNLEKDLFASLGQSWVAYDDPQIAGYGPLGMVAVNKLADPAKAQRALTSLGTALTNTLSGALRGKDIEVAIRQVKSGEITVSYLAIPIVSPSWTIHDGYLYLALYPQTALAAAKRGKPEKSILENGAFIAMRKRLDVAKANTLAFSDLPASLPSNYQMLLAISRTALGAADLLGARAPELVIPPMADLAKLLAPAGSASWSDEQGFHARSISPFPGGQLLSGPSLSSIMTTSAIFSGIAGGARNHARVQINVNNDDAPVKCASHLRQIGQALLLWSNDNKGQYPADLGALLAVDLPADALICPAGNKSIPENWNDLSAEQKADWVNKNSDYIYLGKGMNNAVPKEFIVAYEHDGDHENGMNILFGDGHVELVPVETAKKQIAAQGDRKK